MSNEDTTATETAALATVEPAELAPATMSILPAQKMTLQQIAVARPQAMDAFVEAMASAARNLRKAAFALVDPEDFVLSRDREGNETAMLAGPGAQKIAPLLGIAITNLRGPGGQPVSEPVYENGTAVIIGDIESRVLGTVLESVRAERDESEQFTGRAGNRGDLKSAANTLLLSKGVRVMLGMARIPLAVLKENGIDVARCRKGHGYRKGPDVPVAARVERQAEPAAAHPTTRPEPPVVETPPPGAVSTTILHVGSKEGVTNGRAWKVYFVKTKDGDFGTFSDELADEASRAVGRLAVIEWKPSKKGGREIVSLVAEDAPEAAF